MEGSYAAVISPGAQRFDGTEDSNNSEVQPHVLSRPSDSADAHPPPTRRRSSLTAALFGLRDDSESVSGGPVDDPDLEEAAGQVDVSMRFLCVSRDATEKYLPIVVSISMGAYFGVGVRMLLTEFANTVSSRQSELLHLLGGGFFLPNVVGCYVMGFTGRCKPLLRDRFSVFITGITTGFCGCCTTFASWDVGVGAKFVHGLWITALLMIGVQIASAFVSFRVGVHVADAIIAFCCNQNVSFEKPPVDVKQINTDLERRLQEFEAIRIQTYADSITRRMTTTKEALAAARDATKDLIAEITQDEDLQPTHYHKTSLWAAIAVVLVLWMWIPPFVGFGNYPSSRLFGLALAPFGALLRYYLSLFNSNPAWKDFPLYTFIPNVSASVLSCILILIGSATTDHSSSAYRTYIFLCDGGLIVGFCGSLSTVSTWVNEIDALASRNMFAAYRYASLSVVVSQLATIFILGLYAANSSSPLLVYLP